MCVNAASPRYLYICSTTFSQNWVRANAGYIKVLVNPIQQYLSANRATTCRNRHHLLYYPSESTVRIQSDSIASQEQECFDIHFPTRPFIGITSNSLCLASYSLTIALSSGLSPSGLSGILRRDGLKAMGESIVNWFGIWQWWSQKYVSESSLSPLYKQPGHVPSSSRFNRAQHDKSNDHGWVILHHNN